MEGENAISLVSKFLRTTNIQNHVNSENTQETGERGKGQAEREWKQSKAKQSKAKQSKAKSEKCG